ncbi:MAG: hypothetical protein ACP5O0_05575 [Acidimicrobiales bacterium]
MARMVGEHLLERWRRLWRPRTIFPFLIVGAMIALSQVVNSSVAIFPEAAALSLGTLVLQKESWKSSRPRLVILPTIAAGLGVSIVALGVPTLVGVPILLIIIVLALHFLDSELFPTISAGVLPIVFLISDPWFLLTVFLVVGSIATISVLMDTVAAKKPHVHEAHRLFSLRPPPAGLVRFLIVAVPWIFLARASLPLPAIAPPLLVSIYEWYSRPERRPSNAAKRWIVMVVAGSLGEITTHIGLGAFGVVLAELVLLAFMAVLSSIDPPAMAVLLLPWIAEAISPTSFIFAIAVASLVLYGLGLEFSFWTDTALVGMFRGTSRRHPLVE